MIEEYVLKFLDVDKFLLGFGGEYLVFWLIFKVMVKKYLDLVIIYMDVYIDLCELYEGEFLFYFILICKVCDLIGLENVYFFGICFGMKEEFEWVKEVGMNLYKFDVLELLKEVLLKFVGCLVYVIIDIDVLDLVYVLGIGMLEVGGIIFKELLDFIVVIVNLNINVVGVDLVEVVLVYDYSD